MEQHQDYHPNQLCGSEIQCDLCNSSSENVHDECMECREVADNDQLEWNQERYHHSMERNQVSDYFGDCFCKVVHDKRMERSENSDKHQLEWYQNSHYDCME